MLHRRLNHQTRLLRQVGPPRPEHAVLLLGQRTDAPPYELEHLRSVVHALDEPGEVQLRVPDVAAVQYPVEDLRGWGLDFGRHLPQFQGDAVHHFLVWDFYLRVVARYGDVATVLVFDFLEEVLLALVQEALVAAELLSQLAEGRHLRVLALALSKELLRKLYKTTTNVICLEG